MKFVVHAPYQVPVINSMGYAVGPGQKMFAGFLKTSVSFTIIPDISKIIGVAWHRD